MCPFPSASLLHSLTHDKLNCLFFCYYVVRSLKKRTSLKICRFCPTKKHSFNLLYAMVKVMHKTVSYHRPLLGHPLTKGGLRIYFNVHEPPWCQGPWKLVRNKRKGGHEPAKVLTWKNWSSSPCLDFVHTVFVCVYVCVHVHASVHTCIKLVEAYTPLKSQLQQQKQNKKSILLAFIVCDLDFLSYQHHTCMIWVNLEFAKFWKWGLCKILLTRALQNVGIP